MKLLLRQPRVARGRGSDCIPSVHSYSSWIPLFRGTSCIPTPHANSFSKPCSLDPARGRWGGLSSALCLALPLPPAPVGSEAM